MKAVVLASDDINSYVAAYLMAKKGVELIFLFARHWPQADASIQKELVKTIQEAGGVNTPLKTFDHFANIEAVQAGTPRRRHNIISRRILLKIASQFCKSADAETIVTGEIFGRAVSKTLAEMKIVEEASSVPIIRPLIGLDKLDIENIGKKAGIYNIVKAGKNKGHFTQKGSPGRLDLRELKTLEEQIGAGGLVKASLGTLDDIGL